MTDNTTATAQKNVLILNFIQSIFITEKNKNVSLPSTQLVAKRSNVFFYAFQPEENDDIKRAVNKQFSVWFRVQSYGFPPKRAKPRR